VNIHPEKKSNKKHFATFLNDYVAAFFDNKGTIFNEDEEKTYLNTTLYCNVK
jgi:hypothetical protein